jgi:serine protease Do
MRFRTGFALIAGLLLLIIAGFLSLRSVMGKKTNPALHGISSAAGPKIASAVLPDFEKLAPQVKSAVVNISTEPAVKDTPDSPSPLSTQKRKNLGSGFVIDSRGYILTNSHVVENAAKINVTLADERTVEASVIGLDPETDIALLKARAVNLPSARLARSINTQVGEWVAAFGSPFGMEETMTAGIISAKTRIPDSRGNGYYLQTDAALNPGSSGGPLVNLRGEVVGMSTTDLSVGNGSGGMGFAIPAETIQRVYQELLKPAKPNRGWIGLRIEQITPEIARFYRLKDRSGVLVAEVVPDSPADKAGLEPGDIILRYNERPVQNPRELSAFVADTKAGMNVRIQFLRTSERHSVDVIVDSHPAVSGERFRSPASGSRGMLGITIADVTPETQSILHLTSNRGVLVVDVSPGSAADNGGVEPGDVIHAINHSPVNKASDLLEIARDLKENSTVLLSLERQGRKFFVAFELQ